MNYIHDENSATDLFVKGLIKAAHKRLSSILEERFKEAECDEEMKKKVAKKLSSKLLRQWFGSDES